MHTIHTKFGNKLKKKKKGREEFESIFRTEFIEKRLGQSKKENSLVGLNWISLKRIFCRTVGIRNQVIYSSWSRDP